MVSPSKRILGLTSVTFRNRPAEEILQLCRIIGIDGIEWGGDIHVPPGDLALAQEIQGRRRLPALPSWHTAPTTACKTDRIFSLSLTPRWR